ncbi:MAG: UDP-N-acetylglucosamine 2-epimerase (non-hydrolyzing) [Bacteroidales bacterium]|nr:UDP-N-acetylglucosamine 2-epimerase (non-hydrolyzing) [Bacteroidales bacterium]
MKKLKVMTIVGTRPEIIRLSRTMALLDEHVNHIIVHTGQNYDYELNEIFWEQLELRKPDHFLNVDTSSLGAAVGDIIRKSEEVLKLEQPDAVLVLGDTNSCLAAYMAKRMHIPIFHMEAGNRCFDQNVPEETNRKVIDHIADFNLVYTEHARRHLLSEGLPHRRIYLTGSPMKEVLNYYKPNIDNSDILSRIELTPVTSTSSVTGTSNLEPRKYFLVSVHREENVDNPENLKKILHILNQLAETYQLPVIISTHPRTKKRLDSLNQQPVTSNLQPVTSNQHLIFHKPFGFPDYIHLQQHARCVISDSGTISEESSILSFPAISLRQSMERPEAQDAGTIILTGFEPDIVLNSIEAVIKEFETKSKYDQIAQDYTIENTSWRVLKLILGNTKLSVKWV